MLKRIGLVLLSVVVVFTLMFSVGLTTDSNNFVKDVYNKVFADSGGATAKVIDNKATNVELNEATGVMLASKYNLSKSKLSKASYNYWSKKYSAAIKKKQAAAALKSGKKYIKRNTVVKKIKKKTKKSG